MSDFLAEIYSQPDILLETGSAMLDQVASLKPVLQQVREGTLRRVLFTGMGSSCSAVYPSVLRLIDGGIDARVVEAAELLHYQTALLTAGTLLVVISQSGRSAEIAPLLDLATEHGPSIVGITNTPDSPLQQRSSVSLLLHAGAEATVATKTYTCTLAILDLLTTALLDGDINSAFSDLRTLSRETGVLLDVWNDQMNALADAWEDTYFVEYLGRGYSMASAATGALISKESIKIPTESMNAGQFRHGPIELVDSAFTGILFMGSSATEQLNRTLAADIAAHGGKLALIGQTASIVSGAVWVQMPACRAALLPVAEIIPVQLFCAAMSVRHGYEAGQFRYIEKVTLQE